MKLRKIGSNMSTMTLSGTEVLFSYATPVAYRSGGRYYVTDEKFSVTTTRHVNKWTTANRETVPQAQIEALVA